MPIPCNPYFTGREEILVRLHETLLADNTAALSQPQAITGLGGIGKSQTALEYACRHRAHYQAVLWVLADSQENLITGFVAIANLLELPEKDAQEQSVVVDAVRDWLVTHSGWLLILDNADDLTLTFQFMPTHPQGNLLLTTRAQALGKLARAIAIDKMPMEEGALLLLRRAGVLSSDDQLDAAPEQEREQSETLCTMLDGLPLALDQAGAYIEETGCGLAGYLELFRTHYDRLLAERGQTGDPDHPDSVATTWRLSFDKVKNASPAAADLLRACAFLHPDDIPEELFREGGETLGEPFQAAAEDPLTWNRTLREILKYSLLQRDTKTKTLSMHRLVQTVLKLEMDEVTQSEWAERLVRVVRQSFPAGDFDYKEWPLCERLISNALVCAWLIEQWEFEFSEAAYLLNQVGHYLQGRVRYTEAEPLMRRALTIDETSFGSEHPNVARDLNNLAQLLKATNRLEEAEPLMRRALTIDETSFGSEHPKVAIRLNNLAQLLQDTNRLEEAEPLMRRALTIDETSFGSEHPNVARDLNNLAQLLQDTNRLEEAEPLSRQVVEILLLFMMRTGYKHPHLDTVIENYRGLLAMMGRDEEAQQVEIETLIESVKSRFSA